MRTYCLTLDLINDPELIREYEKYHQKIWPEIYASIKSSGIEKMQIYRFSNRLVMRMEVSDTFSFEYKAAIDAENERVQEWEKLMWKYQQALPGAKPGEKWMLMNQIFELE
jgi:L-rhamnose mutarotase